MNSFRVINAKFRILKGGKIGLSLSIFLLGSMLTLSKTNALATDYFSGVVSNLSTSTDSTGAFGSATTQIRTNTGSTTDTRTSSAYESVVFNPTSWAESTYSAPTFIVDVDTNSDTVLDSSRYNISTTTNGKLSLTLTFDTNANAAAITKDLTTIYNATSVGLVNLNSNSTYNLTTTSNSSDFVSNLIFNGSNNISGATDIEDGNIQLNGGVSFGGTVNAGSIDVLTTSSIIFNSAVDLTAGTTNKLTFYTAGTTNFYGDLTGDIVTTGDNQGTVTFVGDGSGKSQTLTGNVGSSTILDVATLNVGESGVSSNYSTLTVNGNVYANSTVLNNGTTNSSTLILSNGSNITSTITTADAGMGILTLSGSSSVSGQVGTNSNKLKEINAGANGSSSTFSSDVYATNLDVEGTGTVNLDGNYTGTNIRYNADGSVVVADSKNVNSAITTATNNTGTLNLSGSSSVSGQVGTNSNKLKEINAGVNGSSSTFSSDVYATNLDVEGTGTVNLDGNYTGTNIRYNADGSVVVADSKNVNSAITTATNNTGTLNLSGSSSVSGQVGTNSNKLKEINAGVNGSSSTFSSDVYATNLDVEGTGTVNLDGNYTGTNIRYNADGSVVVADSKNVNSAITTATNNTGTLNLSGSSSVSGQVGTNSNKLKEINAGANGSSSTFSSDVYATNLDVEGTGTVNLDGNYTGTNIRYNADGSVVVADSKNVNSAITTATNNTGTLNLSGSSSVSGQVGTNSNKLKEINAGANGSSSTFSSDVYATNLDVEGTGTVNLDGNYTGTNIRYNADGSVIVADSKNVNSAVTTATNNTGTLNLSGSSSVSGQVGTNSNKLKEINAGANGSSSTFSSDVYATNLDVEGTGTVNLDGNYTGTNIRYNADGSVIVADSKNVNSAVTTATNNTGTLNLSGSSTVSGQVGTNSNKLKEINAGANGSSSTFESNVYAINTNIDAGRVDFNTVTGNTISNITFNDAGTTNFYGDLTGDIVTTGDNQGTVTFVGDGSGKSQTLTGNVGSSTILDVATLNVGESGVSSNYSTLTVNGNVYANSTVLNNGTTNSSTLILSNGSNITSTITTADAGMGILTLSGSSSVSGQVGTNSNKLKEINAGANGSSSTFSSDVYATNLNVVSTGEIKFESNLTAEINPVVSNEGIITLTGDNSGKAQLVTGNIGEINTLNIGDANNSNYSNTTIDGNVSASNVILNNDSTIELTEGSTIVTSTIKTATNNTGTITINGSTTVTGEIGTSTEKLKEINAGISSDDVVVFQSGVNDITTNIGDGRVDFNTVTGTTTSDIVFNGTGTANFYGGITGDISFAGNNATVNVKDGKGILGSVDTLANNTGILNYEGDGSIDGVIGSALYGIKELNVNTNDEQDKDGSGNVITQGLFVNREIFADIINLRNNATLTLADDVNLTNTGTNNLIISTDSSNKGKIVFLGSSVVTGEVGTSSNNLSNITAGVTGETVTFNDMVYANTLKYSDDGTVVLNGDNSLNANSEGFIGTVDFDSKAGTLEIGDSVNLNVDSSGIQFTNGNDAILRFAGDTTVNGVLGGNTAGNSTFEEIYAGLNGKTATFKDDVYVEENTFHVGDGTVNFEGNLTGSLIFDDDGIVNMDNGKSVIVSSSSESIKTLVDGNGTVNFKGETTLYGDIGTSINKLKEVNFATLGNSATSYTQNLNKNIYALNTTIGNGTNNTSANILSDIRFGGSLDIKSNSSLNVSNYDVTVDDNLNLASNTTTKFKVYTTDISAGQAEINANSGSITTDSLTVASDSKIHIDYEGSWQGAGAYNLITSNSLTGTFDGTEENGLVSDNSIIDSIVKNDGNNITLYADRTGGGSFKAEDLYIVKSEIGEDYSNNASKALANYANDVQRAGALADIIRDIEELDDGLTISQAKKDEMVAMQRKLTPIANSSNIQTAVTSTNLATTTIGSRLSDIRRTEANNFTPNIYSGNYAGLSSGDYGYDTSFWVKGMGAKATQDKVKDYYGFNSTTYGLVAGMDKTMYDGTIFGIAVGYSDTKTNQDNVDSDSSNTNSIQATIYSSQEFGDTYLDGYLSYSKHTTDGTRTANSGKVTSSVDSDQISAKVEAGHKFRVNDGISITPFASLEYSLLNQKGYQEKGSTYQNDALKVDGLKLNRGAVEVGAKLISNIELEDTLIIPQFTTSIYNTFGDNKADIKAQYIGGGDKFVTPVQELNQTMINIGFGVETKISDSTSLIFDIEHDRSKDGTFEAYSGSVTFGVSF